jgi:hypothetical protein
MKMVRPLVERPYVPTEVERISEPKRKIMNKDSMTKAQIVGSNSGNKGEEKPSMYSTVITKHATSVVHPVPQPTSYGIKPEFGNHLANSIENPIPLSPGAYSIPVKIEKDSVNDPTLSAYESPSFIHKGEKKLKGPKSDKSNIHAEPETFMDEKVMEKILTEDANNFVGQFDDKKSKDERIIVLEEGKAKLEAEIQKLSDDIETEMADLLFGKEVAMKMNNVLYRYESRFSKDNLSKLKLADEIDIKNLLREKLHRELQGFRTSTSEYAELDKFNPDDIVNIVQQINSIVGY